MSFAVSILQLDDIGGNPCTKFGKSHKLLFDQLRLPTSHWDICVDNRQPMARSPLSRQVPFMHWKYTQHLPTNVFTVRHTKHHHIQQITSQVRLSSRHGEAANLGSKPPSSCCPLYQHNRAEQSCEYRAYCTGDLIQSILHRGSNTKYLAQVI